MRSGQFIHNRIPASLAIFLLLSACGNGTYDGVACTTEARSSVDISVLDTLGLPMRDYEVQYQINQGAVQQTSCKTSSPCAIDFEKVGVFSFTVSKSGFQSTSGEVTVSRDVCHVITQRVTLTLKAF
jgi:hypothetical protein